jgi:cytochrome c oxidase subunit 2
LVDTRDEFRSLFDLYVPIALVVFAVIVGLILFALVRFRRRNDQTPSRRTEAPALEIIVAVALAATVVLLTGRTFSVESRVDRVAADAPLHIDVVASKWKWRFTYPRYGRSEVSGDIRPATLVVPSGQTVQFRMRSLDVIHSFFVPKLRFKRDAFPERTTKFDLVFHQPGFTGRCAEFCGLHHADMRFNVEVLPPDEFASWAAERRTEAGGQ